MSASSTASGSPESSGNGHRLESWKEIATYLKRDIRTVQRWEKSEGLPVHRHLHEERGSVFAYAAEVATWVEGRVLKEPTAAPELISQHFPRRRTALLVTLLLVLVGSTLFFVRQRSVGSRPSASALPFQERDWVLIAAFENRTGERVFDGGLEYALERELSNSRFVNVVPPERIGDALRLMEKPANTKVDTAVAREICLRDGAIRGFLTGRIERLSNKYVLSVALRDPSRGVMTASWEEDANDQGDVLAALHRISIRVRESLGDRLASNSPANTALVKVTTPSLRALQLYSVADALIFEQRDSPAAEQLLRLAIAEDPTFASGYIHLAHSICNQNRPSAEYLPFARHAYELRATVPERERYFIEGSYFEMLGRDEEASTAYQTLINLYPDHFWARNNLAGAFLRLGRKEAYRESFAAATELRPNDFQSNVDAAWELASDPARARIFILRAQKLITPEIVARHPIDAAWLEEFSALYAFANGDIKTSRNEILRLHRTIGSRRGPDREQLIVNLWELYVNLGEFHEAESILEKLSSSRFRHERLARLALLRGDPIIAGQQALQASDAPPDPSVIFATLVPTLLARIGKIERANVEIGMLEEKKAPRYVRLARAEVALARNHGPKAIAELQKCADAFRTDAFPGFFIASWDVARLLDEHGDRSGALHVLEAASRERLNAELVGSAAFWMRNQFELARRYRALERTDEAKKIEAELLGLLTYADADNPMLVELRRLATSS